MSIPMSEFIKPSYLQHGDTVGITCPAGSVNLDEMQPMFAQLRDWGLRLKIGKTVGTNYFKFSATDEERLNDLQTMLDDDEVKAIFFGRGGYGAVRIIDRLDFTKFCKHPKWLVGYSDITCLHSHVHTQFGVATLHAHMGVGYKPEEFNETSTQSIYDSLFGLPIKFSVEPNELNRNGDCKGVLIGGNLALLSDLIGTKSDIETEGKILVIEDIGEYKYNIDRMMWQLLRAGKLDKLAGLIVGAFVNTLDNEIPFGMTEQEIVLEKIKDSDYPVCFDFKVGHQRENYALLFGAEYELQITDEGVQLIGLSV